jgi:hypothetical protein
MKLIIKNHKNIYEDVSKDLNVSLELVQTIGSHAWKELKTKFNTLEHHEIYMLGLGSFKSRKMQMIKEIKYIDLNLENLEMSKYLDTREKIIEKREELTLKKERLQALCNEIDRIRLEKREFKIRRNEQQMAGGISEQEQDLGRTEE